MRSVFSARPDEVRRGRWGWVGVWLPPVIAMMVIACESTPTFSANNTSGALRPIFERIFGHINDTLWWWLHMSFRKSGHFFGYGMVGLTFLRAWMFTLAPRFLLWKWRLWAAGLGVHCTSIVAGLDEWHQTFLPSRTGKVSDVGIDTCGAVLMFLVVGVLFWRGRRKA